MEENCVFFQFQWLNLSSFCSCSTAENPWKIEREKKVPASSPAPSLSSDVHHLLFDFTLEGSTKQDRLGKKQNCFGQKKRGQMKPFEVIQQAFLGLQKVYARRRKNNTMKFSLFFSSSNGCSTRSSATSRNQSQEIKYLNIFAIHFWVSLPTLWQINWLMYQKHVGFSFSDIPRLIVYMSM